MKTDANNFPAATLTIRFGLMCRPFRSDAYDVKAVPAYRVRDGRSRFTSNAYDVKAGRRGGCCRNRSV